GNMANGAEVILTVVANIKASGDYTNVAEVSADQHDHDLTNNEDEVTVVPSASTMQDANSGVVNKVIPGDVSTNDVVPAGTTYGPAPAASSSPAGSTPVLTVNPDGSYTFTTDVAGIYEYDVPVHVPGHASTTERLVITVTDPMSNTNPPVLNNDNSTTPYETAVTHNVLSNDQAGNGGG